MDKKQYLKSFLKPGQTRLPRKIKKYYLKHFEEGGPIIVHNLTQFLNIYKVVDQVVTDSINDLINTSVGKRLFQPN